MDVAAGGNVHRSASGLPGRFAIAKRDGYMDWKYLVTPRWRGEIDWKGITSTNDRAQAMTWSEKSGAYKYLKRHPESLAGCRVLALRV